MWMFYKPIPNFQHYIPNMYDGQFLAVDLLPFFQIKKPHAEFSKCNVTFGFIQNVEKPSRKGFSSTRKAANTVYTADKLRNKGFVSLAYEEVRNTIKSRASIILLFYHCAYL
jgi:hypothetical protein